ncbi:protein phosphatase 1 regulatory subunit 12A isoform X2 [Schistocerca gregaria]|uniref:protein phosphatase 1 regulatory subunit 12A isoform X2 n=1 Tax=Schistocerca gregaria TaxID=7010 RepID=UPI00211ED176|nr:protein phosphatase 1 regulatory subunit 12A isoform X2 [Schistocerca gregaria]
MSIETRSNSALFKRAEQLKRWEESETNRVPGTPNRKKKKIQFSAGCVFLAACAAGDKEEVLRLLQKGADIDTANVDGLTALHQACIDDNLDMVEFLVEHGADVNRGDNEGWTPLHATASCGFISIAKYLIEHGGNVAAVNNDAELPVDIAESDEMEEMLQQNIEAKGIDCDEARNEEERMMLEDAKAWLNSGFFDDEPHPKTGARALHVAAAKGYIKVMRVLLQGGADVNVQDFDGWTPLHAAAHWGQKEACEMLVENFCDMEMKNYVGQTAFDIADPDMIPVLEELQKRQAAMQRDHAANNAILQKKGTNNSKRRSSITRMSVADKSNLINKDASSERQILDQSISEEDSTNKMLKVKVEIEPVSDKEDTSEHSDVSEVEDQEQSSDSSDSSDDTETSNGSETQSSVNSAEEKKNKANRDDTAKTSSIETNKLVPNSPSMPSNLPQEIDDPSRWRRPGSLRSRGANGEEDITNKTIPGNVEKENQKVSTPTGTVNRTIVDKPEVSVRRTRSFEADEKFYPKYLELKARIKAGSCPTLHSSSDSALPTRSASLRDKCDSRGIKKEADDAVSPVSDILNAVTTGTTTITTHTSPTRQSLPVANSPLPTNQVRSFSPPKDSAASTCPPTPPTPTTPGGSKLSPGNIFKNFFKSFVPPVRDEESETQRKAHAKRVRETRRSTQGVTLEEIKSAEQLVKRKNQQQLQQATQQLSNNEQLPAVTNSPSITATITTASPTVPSKSVATGGKEEEVHQERRPSWRLRVDNGDRNKFLLEDARSKSTPNDTAATTYVRRTSGSTPVRPSSAPVDPSSVDTTVTIALRRQSKPPDDRDQDKENDIRNAQATQGVIQRRRRPKRRSTGVVHVDMDEIDPDRQDALTGGETLDIAKGANDESGGSPQSSRLSSPAADSPINSRHSSTLLPHEASENGEIDYKKLYEALLLENERIKEKLQKTEEALNEARVQISSSSIPPPKNSLSEMEKRERRAMERKLSEMEEELKLLEQFRSENQKLKDENGALIRVISKLSK